MTRTTNSGPEASRCEFDDYVRALIQNTEDPALQRELVAVLETGTVTSRRNDVATQPALLEEIRRRVASADSHVIALAVIGVGRGAMELESKKVVRNALLSMIREDDVIGETENGDLCLVLGLSSAEAARVVLDRLHSSLMTLRNDVRIGMATHELGRFFDPSNLVADAMLAASEDHA